jgi:hypothetical protein
MRGIAAIALVAGVHLSLPAFAAAIATVQTMQGQVTINRGNGYEEVVSWADGHAGDKVMAGPGGYGKIIYSNGCVVNVRPGAVVAVQDEPPCRDGAVIAGHPYLIAGAMAAGVVAGIVSLSGGNDNNNNKHSKPASP